MAGSPGGKSVGRVSVKVVPDTSKFAEELKAKLEKLERDLKVVIDTALDTSGAEAQAAALEKKLESNPIDIPVRLNTKGANFQRQMKSIQGAASGLGAPLLAVGRMFDSIARSIDNTAEALIRARKATAGFVAQTGVWAAQIVRQIFTLHHLIDAMYALWTAAKAVANAIKSIPRLALLARDLALSAASASKLGGIRLVNFVKPLFQARTYVDLALRGFIRLVTFPSMIRDGLKKISFSNILSGLRKVRTSAANTGKAFSRGLGSGIDFVTRGLGKALSNSVRGVGQVFTKAGSAISGFAGGLASMSKFALIGVAILALLAPALGLVVGLLAAIPSGIFLLAAPIAAIALGLDGIKAAAKAAEPAFNKLKEAVSSTFEKSLTPVFKRINDVLLPGITKGVQGVAQGVSGIAKSFIDVVTSAQGMKQINSILDNTKKFFEGFRPFITEFTGAFLTLAQVGSDRFAGMAKSMSDWAKEFNGVIQAAAKSGVLDSALAGLGQVMSALGSGFNQLFGAGLTAMAQLGGPLAELLGGFFDLFVALMPALTVVSKVISEVLGAAMQALVPIINALMPSFETLASIVGELLLGAVQILQPLLMALADILGAVLMPIFKALQPVIKPIIDFLVSLAVVIGTTLLTAMQVIQPLLDKLIQFAVGLLEALLPLLPSLLQLASVILTALLQILMPLIPPLMQLAEMIFPLLVQVVQMLVPVIIELANALIQIVPFLVDIVTTILNAVIPVMQALLQVVADVWPHIKSIIEAAINIVKGIIEVVLGIISGDWDRVWNGLVDILKGAWDLVVSAVKGAIQLVISTVKELPSAILGALGDLGGLLWDAGKSLIQGFINGIKNMFGAVKDVAGDIMGAVRDFFPFSPAKKGPFAGRGYTVYSGRALAEDFAKGIEDRAPLAARAVEDMMSGANNTATAEWRGVMSADGFGAIGDRIVEALNGMEMKADGHIIAKVVNNENRKKARR